jgi:hypothetical protein
LCGISPFLNSVVYVKVGAISPLSPKSSALYRPILVYCWTYINSQQKRVLVINKVAIESYVRNLVGQIIGAVMIVSQTSGIASPLEFGSGEWLLVANALWASIIPTALRWLNKKDPAFGRIAEVAAKEVSKKLAAAPKKKAK